ncbi:MAG: hypothetical protein COA78_05260 [Blastopirellula sp.]|nr:MAG: hypothetical protein COA78_05260 [Blastopirellula sp.]
MNYNFGRPGIWLYILSMVIALMATEEVLFLLRNKEFQPSAWPCYLGTFLVMGTAGIPIYWPRTVLPMPEDHFKLLFFSLILSFLLVIAEEMRRYQEPGKSMIRIGLSMLTIIYIGGLMSFFAFLRLLFDAEKPHANEWGMLALLSMIIVVKLSDSGAFFTGKLIGKNKLIPRLSPGKTIEGSLGGLVAACLGSWFAFGFLLPWFIPDAPSLGAVNIIAYGLLVGIAGMLGDLAESLFKRDMESKDSSTWLKGLGGILDIMDSLLFAAPIAWFCWTIGLVGP